MKRELPIEAIKPQYFGNWDAVGLLDDLVGIFALGCVDNRLRCLADWFRLVSLRLVSQWWSHIIDDSLIASSIHTLNIHCVHDFCPYWKEPTTSLFPMLDTLALHASHPLATRIATLPNLRSLAIDGWLPEITQLERLERLAVFDSDNLTPDDSLVVPPRSLTTLVLMDKFLTDGIDGKQAIVAVLRTLPNLRSLILSTGVDNITNDPQGTEILNFLPNIEQFRWHAYYYGSYECILKDFIYAETL